MNKTDRLLAIVLKLQRDGKLRAEDLATYFETSKRTIYRDLQALSEAGVPLVAVPGQGYSLVEGYFLPPLSFSSDEAIILLLGGEYIAQNFDARYQAGARSASLKIENVLPPQVRTEVEGLRSSIRFISAPSLPDDSAVLKELRRAVVESKTISFHYYGRNKTDGATERRADPYGLIYYNGTWYLVAHDQERQDLRNFRLDRIENLSVTAQTFERPAGFKLDQSRPDDDRPVTVRVRFDKKVARWVRESRYFYITELQDESDGGLTATLQVRQESEVLGWLLGWGRQAQVLEPTSLQRLLIEELEGILSRYQKAATLLT